MKLFKVIFETQVMVLAEDVSEAINCAERYVSEERHDCVFSEVVESVNDLGEWEGAIPYSARREYNEAEQKCEEFVND